MDRKGLKGRRYISWPTSCTYPVVRVPTPSGTPESRTITGRDNESDAELLERSVAYRDRRGVEVWGEKRWREMLSVKRRSVAKHRKSPAGPIAGVYQYNRPDGAPVWIASWYSLESSGSRRKRSKQFSYGTPKAAYARSEDAMLAAIERRKEEERRWYSVNRVGGVHEANRI